MVSRLRRTHLPSVTNMSTTYGMQVTNLLPRVRGRPGWGMLQSFATPPHHWCNVALLRCVHVTEDVTEARLVCLCHLCFCCLQDLKLVQHMLL